MEEGDMPYGLVLMGFASVEGSSRSPQLGTVMLRPPAWDELFLLR
jgi:hypothetical protein